MIYSCVELSGHKISSIKAFEVQNSEILSTQVHLPHNTITGCYKAVKTYDQMIQWGGDCILQIPFAVSSIQFSCTCPFFTKSEATPVKCCKHIAGHLRNYLHFSNLTYFPLQIFILLLL